MIDYIIKLKRKTNNILKDRWVWKMAWRDGRHNFSRLSLFMAALITGIAAVVAIDSLNYSMQDELDRNAKELLGADLVINGNKKFDTAWTNLLYKSKVTIAKDADMASMVMFMNTRNSRLVKVTGLEGPFPFYGQMVTKPADAYLKTQTGNYVMLDESLATQYEVSSDDSIKVGNKVFIVSGVVTKIPGGGGLTSTLAPAVYVSMSALDATGLIQFGSRIGYSIYIKTKSDKETESLIEKVKPLAKRLGNS